MRVDFYFHFPEPCRSFRLAARRRIRFKSHGECPLAASHGTRSPRVHGDALLEAPPERLRRRRRQIRVAGTLAVLHDVHRHLPVGGDGHEQVVDHLRAEVADELVAELNPVGQGTFNSNAFTHHTTFNPPSTQPLSSIYISLSPPVTRTTAFTSMKSPQLYQV